MEEIRAYKVVSRMHTKYNKIWAMIRIEGKGSLSWPTKINQVSLKEWTNI